LPPGLSIEVYARLRAIAASHLSRERVGHTLQPTALAHEAFLRLGQGPDGGWNGQDHFLAAAAEAVRRVLVDHARARDSLKRGGGRERVTIADVEGPAETSAVDLLALDEAMQALADLNPRQARVVELKYFAGLENRAIAAAMGISETLVKREWRFARAWLAARLSRGGVPAG
jgi:RNA polymerase sigma factor (TIGR02999 family)